jgi:hypothetical protein
MLQLSLTRLCCTDAEHEERGRNAPNPICYLSDTDIVRASKSQHPVQGSRGDGNLGRLALVCARPQGIADHALEAADRRLHPGSQIVTAGFLPGHSATFGGQSQVTVALCRSGLGRSARNRAGPGRHDDGSVRITLGNCLVNPVLIVAAVGDKGGNGIGDLVEQRVNQRGIVDIRRGSKPAGFG